jgi:mono/diheme cytochrome c family protein
MLAGKMPVAAEVIDHAHLQPSTVKPGRTLEYGRYLAVGCIGCHGPNYTGGKIEAGPPDWPAAANLTPHPNGAVTSWTEADFMQTLRSGRRPNGTELNPAMPRNFGLMNDEELGALWLFLKSLPAAPTGTR